MLVDATSRRDINTVHKSHLSNKLIELPSYQLFHYVNQFEIKKKQNTWQCWQIRQFDHIHWISVNLVKSLFFLGGFKLTFDFCKIVRKCFFLHTSSFLSIKDNILTEMIYTNERLIL